MNIYNNISAICRESSKLLRKNAFCTVREFFKKGNPTDETSVEYNRLRGFLENETDNAIAEVVWGIDAADGHTLRRKEPEKEKQVEEPLNILTIVIENDTGSLDYLYPNANLKKLDITGNSVVIKGSDLLSDDAKAGVFQDIKQILIDYLYKPKIEKALKEAA